jgi:hypothetical protein
MATLWYGHFDSAPDDHRELTAERWAKYNAAFVTNGVLNLGANLRVTPRQGTQVQVEAGIAHINGYVLFVEEDTDGRHYSVMLSAAHQQYDRIDRLVLRLDTAQESRVIRPVVSRGVASEDPVPPALKRDGNVYELSLARIHVRAGAAAIEADDIHDERAVTDLCGVVNSVRELDSTAWQMDFDTFMAGVRMRSENGIDTLFTDLGRRAATLYDGIKGLYAALETQSFTLINNNFDDWSVKRGTNTQTERIPGGVKTTITVAASGFAMAEREMARQPDGSILTTVRFRPWEMTENGNTIRTTPFSISRRAYKTLDGKINSEVR